MKQFLLPCAPDAQGQVQLEGKDAHYLAGVRRVKVGQVLPCRYPSGEEANMVVTSICHASVMLHVQAESVPSAHFSDSQAHNLPHIHLVQCLPKGAKMDTIIRQAMESGVSCLYPVSSSNAVPDLAGKEQTKVARWQRIAREAFQQSGHNHLMEINEPMPLENACRSLVKKYGGSFLGLYCHEQTLAKATLHGYCSGKPKEIAVVIGPEGGLSPNELQMLDAFSFKSLYLGPGVLRTETAALFAVAAIRITTLEADSWVPITRNSQSSNAE